MPNQSRQLESYSLPNLSPIPGQVSERECTDTQRPVVHTTPTGRTKTINSTQQISC